MKRAFFLAAILFSLLAPLAAQSITVTSPAAGAQWCQGTGYAITWTSTGVSGPLAIKLRLANAPDAPPVLDIVASTANSGSFSWPVPAAVAPGAYVVRVRTVSDSPLVYDDSDAFTIKTCGGAAVVSHLPAEPLPSVMLQLPRLEVSDIDLAPNTEGFGIVFSYKNAGNGPLPKAAEVPVKPNYRVLIDGKETASGSLFIPAFAAPPGWEQKGYFGGMITLPTWALFNHMEQGPRYSYSLNEPCWQWSIGNMVTAHINENKVMGMDSHSLALNLRSILLLYGYDLMCSGVSFDWNTRRLTVTTRLNGKMPANRKVMMLCYGLYLPQIVYWLVEEKLDQNQYTFTCKVDVPASEKHLHFEVYTIVLPTSCQEKIADIDLRNNVWGANFDRPPRPAVTPH